MDFFNYRSDAEGETLWAENCAISFIVKQHGTPLYIYSRATIERHWHAFNDAVGEIPHLICYAVKASSNLAILNLLARLGAGFDIVSSGELARVIKAGGCPEKIVFSGVAKSKEEIIHALDVGIHCFNVESPDELKRINQIALAAGKIAPISLRVNPDVDPGTHPYISTGLKENKFGISFDDAKKVYLQANEMSGIKIKGIDCHIGSQITEIAPFMDSLDKLLALIDWLAENDIQLQHIDVGGGLGVRYQDETPPHPREYLQALQEKLSGRNLSLVLEPGRAIMANAGILVTKVEYLKTASEKNFAIVDAGMNDLLRPALYQTWQEIIPVQSHSNLEFKQYDVVGPVCESSDFLGKDRELAVMEGDLLAIRSAGAYGFSLSSNYNSRCRVAEVMVDKEQIHLIREREALEALWRGENLLPE